MKITLVTLCGLLVVGAAAAPAGAQRREPEDARARRDRAEAFTFVTPRPLVPDRAVIGVLLGDATEQGIRVDEVTPGGPAERAGLRAGDYLVGVGTVELRLQPGDAEDPYLRATAARRLTRALEAVDAGDEVTLRVDSAGRSRTVRLRTVRADALEPTRAEREPRSELRVLPREGPREGPRAERLLPEWGAAARERATLGLTVTSTGTARDSLGAFVAAVVPGGPAERAGVFEGARIASIDGVELGAPRATAAGEARPGEARERDAGARTERLAEALRDHRPGDEVTLRVYVDGAYRTVRVRTASAAEVYRDDPQALLEGAAPFIFRSGPEGLFGPGGRLRILPDAGAGVWRFDSDGVQQLRPRIERKDDGTVRIEMRRPGRRVIV